MDKPIPIRLAAPPIVEAVWELRFESESDSPVDLLPGILFERVGERYNQIQRLPAADLPVQALQLDPNLRHAPTARLASGSYSIQVGRNVLALSCYAPYPGWKAFKSEIRSIAEIVRTTSVVGRAERFSLKYVNILPTEKLPTMSPLDIELRINGHDLTQAPTHVRTELREQDCLVVVQVGSPAQVQYPGERASVDGILIDIDAIWNAQGDSFWETFEDRLESVRDIGRKLFFRVLTAATIESLGPEYS
ncbi:MAG: TIGR04255 family protein [Gammaproteobacteria bacterium]|nr:TIGR04255 family protein [Gammaproteobacteria bacterium]